MDKSMLLRSIPQVDQMIHRVHSQVTGVSDKVIAEIVRGRLEALRLDILAGEVSSLPDEKEFIRSVAGDVKRMGWRSLRPVINATGITLHTNLGRACLSEQAVEAICATARNYSTLEYDVSSGSRGSRHSHVTGLLKRITGAEDAMVVNNNAAAVLLILSYIGGGGEVITSRGELVEIGGSFRIPDVMEQCGCRLKEVGTTNKTHISDYSGAVGSETRALLKVHTSNYRVVGFTESVPVSELVQLGRDINLPVIEDLGSGCLCDLSRCGIYDEPTVMDSVRTGVDIVSFSGDKLLGGPQAGIIVGRREYISALKKHPLSRAMRVDKLTMAALEATLNSYLDEEKAWEEIPTLKNLSAPIEDVYAKALCLQKTLAKMEVSAQIIEDTDQIGGGSLPTKTFRTWAVAISPEKMSITTLEERMRKRRVPVIGRISREKYLLDMRTVRKEQIEEIALAVREALE